MMNHDKLDRMMKAYCDPETEAFSYHKKKHRGFKAASVIAAALVLTILGALIVPSLTQTEHGFVLKVNAAESGVSDRQVGTAYTRMTLYDKDHVYVGEYFTMDTEILIDGEDIDGIRFRSLNGLGAFILWENPVKGDLHDDCGTWYNADGKEDGFFQGATYQMEEDDYYAEADITYTNDWSTEYRYDLNYVALNDEGTFLQPEEATDSRNDIIEITVTFTDGDTLTKRLSVTYPDGIMTVTEIDA